MINPLAPGLSMLGRYGYGLYTKNHRRGHRMRRTVLWPKPRHRAEAKRPTITISDDASSWDMPELWIVRVGQPRFQRYVRQALAKANGNVAEAFRRGLLHPVSATYSVLRGQIGDRKQPLQRSAKGRVLTYQALQARSPGEENYYPHAAILGLYDAIHEAAESALRVIEQTGDPTRGLLFPV